MIERPIRFDRKPRMRCGSCRHEWHVTEEWTDGFNQALETCPRCGTDCQSDDRPKFSADPSDLAANDDTVRQLYWYHSSTHAQWPDRDYDPAATLTDITKQRMEAMMPGRNSVEEWAKRQKTKALHIGTYEAAIENMFRRMDDQSCADEQFFLYRVRLQPDCVVEPGVHSERTNIVGDTQLAEVCGPDANVFRYVNVHEDPSSISLAVSIDAVHSVQRIAVPLAADAQDSWVQDATARLSDAAPLPSEVSAQWGMKSTTGLASEARRIEKEVANLLPLRLGDRFSPHFDEMDFGDDPTAFPKKLMGLLKLVTDPHAALDALAHQPWREV